MVRKRVIIGFGIYSSLFARKDVDTAGSGSDFQTELGMGSLAFAHRWKEGFESGKRSASGSIKETEQDQCKKRTASKEN